jgi:hypothetical protein
MSKAMEQIVQVYVRHLNRRALEDLRKHRQKLALEFRARARPGCDFGLPIRHLNEDISVIKAGLERPVIVPKAAWRIAPSNSTANRAWNDFSCVTFSDGAGYQPHRRAKPRFSVAA